MRIEVHLFGTSRRSCLGEPFWMSVPDGESVEWVLGRLSIPLDAPLFPLIDGERVGKDRVLNDGEVLKLFPLIAGG